MMIKEKYTKKADLIKDIFEERKNELINKCELNLSYDSKNQCEYFQESSTNRIDINTRDNVKVSLLSKKLNYKWVDEIFAIEHEMGHAKMYDNYHKKFFGLIDRITEPLLGIVDPKDKYLCYRMTYNEVYADHIAIYNLIKDLYKMNGESKIIINLRKIEDNRHKETDIYKDICNKYEKYIYNIDDFANRYTSLYFKLISKDRTEEIMPEIDNYFSNRFRNTFYRLSTRYINSFIEFYYILSRTYMIKQYKENLISNIILLYLL